ncbi:hypothetical protein EJ110_NYTH46677 [Nymphaea thermarum]|nr:hypothetical protein EJ110_NYTH46677 [Nymphaea thermarum]
MPSKENSSRTGATNAPMDKMKLILEAKVVRAILSSFASKRHVNKLGMPSSMDPEMEKHLASMLIQEATTLRQQADKEGVHIYLQRPQQRNRPNSRFLSATVLGVQQANRVTEVNEMWRIREKELELNGQLKRSDGTSGRHRSPDHGHQKCHSADCCSTSSRTDRKRLVNNTDDPCVSNSLVCSSGFSPEHDGALKDEELEDFLRSRAKRGRGSVGSRMDELGPYLPSVPSNEKSVSPDSRLNKEWERHIFGPDKPSWLNVPQDKDDIDLSKQRKKAAKESNRSEKRKCFISSNHGMVIVATTEKGDLQLLNQQALLFTSANGRGKEWAKHVLGTRPVSRVELDADISKVRSPSRP